MRTFKPVFHATLLYGHLRTDPYLSIVSKANMTHLDTNLLIRWMLSMQLNVQM